MIRILWLTALILTGCLKTRGDLRAESTDETPQRQTVAAQRDAARQTSAAPGGGAVLMTKPAPPSTPAQRMDDVDEQMRTLTGRLEALENGMNQAAVADETTKNETIKDKLSLEQRLLAYEESIKKLNADVAALTEQVATLKAPPPPPPEPPKPAKPPIDEANELLVEKKWKEAAAAFQKYREQNPKGKLYGDATYKIGVCFQELGMKDEARAFFDEVAAKFPGSKDAKKAQFRSKQLK